MPIHGYTAPEPTIITKDGVNVAAVTASGHLVAREDLTDEQKVWLRDYIKAAGFPDKTWADWAGMAFSLGFRPSLFPWLVAAGLVGWLLWRRFKK